MKKTKKILLIIFSVLIVFFLSFHFIFYRKDLKTDYLESKYFTEYSNYETINILSLENDELSIRIHYQDLGDENNQVIVLLHGAFSSSHTFFAWALDLVEAGYRVIMPDLPYFGLSDGFDDYITSYRRNAQVVKGLLDSLSIDSVHIAGNSLGGATSWYFASLYPSNVKSLNLIDAVYPYENLSNRANSISNDFLAKTLSKYTPRFLFNYVLKTAYGNPENINEDDLTRYYELLRKENTRYAILKSSNEEITNLETRLSGLKDYDIPILVMWGRLDSWIAVETANDFKQTLNLSDDFVIIYEELGHAPMEEDPKNTITDYLDFLNSIND